MRTRYRMVAAVGVIVVLAGACGSRDGDAADQTADEAAGATTTATAADQTTTNTGDSTAASVAPTTTVASTASTTMPPTTSLTPTTLEGPRTTAEATPEDPVPVGEVIEIEGLWDITVTTVDVDATEEVLAFADINPEPEAGYQYVMITIEGVYLGDRVAQPVFEWAISGGGATFEPSIPGCGVVPDSIYDVIEVIPGQHFLANLCVPVTSDSVAAGLELFLQPLGDEARYFDLG